jgi:PASTA domain
MALAHHVPQTHGVLPQRWPASGHQSTAPPVQIAGAQAGHAANEGGASIWYSWTPCFNDVGFVSTEGSSFDTLLGVYTGSSVSSLTLAGNDDANAQTLLSKACFPVTSSSTYMIAVDGLDAADPIDGEGDVTLDWGQYLSSHKIVRCKVPKVAGLTLKKARARIVRAHCRVGKVTKTFSTRRKKGRVLSQKPKPGRLLAAGARVNLVVGKGPRR